MNELDKIRALMQRRFITTLYHFTHSAHLPYIFSNNEKENGLQATDNLRKVDTLDMITTDVNRYDKCTDAVCCSVSRINYFYFKTARNRERNDSKILYHDWCILAIDAKVIDDTTLFCPFNAATGRGRYITSGAQGFESIFADEVRNIKRYPGTPSNYATDVQAEILVKNKIPVEKIKGIYFSPDMVTMEYYRLKLWLSEQAMSRLNLGIYLPENNYELRDLSF